MFKLISASKTKNILQMASFRGRLERITLIYNMALKSPLREVVIKKGFLLCW